MDRPNLPSHRQIKLLWNRHQERNCVNNFLVHFHPKIRPVPRRPLLLTHRTTRTLMMKMIHHHWFHKSKLKILRTTIPIQSKIHLLPLVYSIEARPQRPIPSDSSAVCVSHDSDRRLSKPLNIIEFILNTFIFQMRNPSSVDFVRTTQTQNQM